MANIRVHALTTYTSPNSLALIYPLLINRPFFNKKGLKIYFYERVKRSIYNCDILFINSKFFRTWYPKKEKEIYDTLTDFKRGIQKVVWFDTTDSTGTTQFNVMPFVDAYYKSQLLKDRSLYTKSFYGYRIFTDYYKRIFGIDDEIELNHDEASQKKAASYVLQKEDEHKLGVSWNSAMNEWGGYDYVYGNLMAKIKSHLPFKTDYKVCFINPDKERKADVLGRIGLSHIRNTVRYQRERIAKILSEKFNADVFKIPRKQYLNEIKDSKIGVSPFGLGEISCRDFDIIINGALLFKGDMSHLETWPPLYVNDETYVPYSWDLEDFEERLNDVLNNRQRMVEISKRAQELYTYYLYGDGRLEFCNRVLDIIR